MSVYGSNKHTVARDRDTTIDRIAAHIVSGQAAFVVPVRTAGSSVQRENVGGRLTHIHDAIHHDGSGFDAMARRHLLNPGHTQSRHIIAIDLVERAVAPAL